MTCRLRREKRVHGHDYECVGLATIHILRPHLHRNMHGPGLALRRCREPHSPTRPRFRPAPLDSPVEPHDPSFRRVNADSVHARLSVPVLRRPHPHGRWRRREREAPRPDRATAAALDSAVRKRLSGKESETGQCRPHYRHPQPASGSVRRIGTSSESFRPISSAGDTRSLSPRERRQTRLAGPLRAREHLPTLRAADRCRFRFPGIKL